MSSFSKNNPRSRFQGDRNKPRSTMEHGKDGTAYVDSRVSRNNMTAEHRARERNGAIGNAAIAVATAPAKLMGWLTSHRGGKVMIGVLAAYCAGLSIEAWYVTLPSVAGQGGEENRRFMPKPFVDDGADLGLLNPLNALPVLWDAAMGVLQSMLPFQLKGATPEPVRCVWLDWRFYVAVMVSLSLQLWQAKALRSLTIDQRRRKAQELQGYKKMNLDPKSLDIANAKVAEYNQSLMGKRRANGAMIFISYAVELGTGFASITGSRGVGILTAGVYCIIQAFGFEVMLNQLQDEEETTVK
jgi:hypothetical protein